MVVQDGKTVTSVIITLKNNLGLSKNIDRNCDPDQCGYL